MILNLFDRMKLPFRKNKEFLTALYNILGFYPHNIEVYRIAFSHKSLSYHNENVNKDRKGRERKQRSDNASKPLNNERLEYLGDAVLETVVSDILFRYYPNKREGFLTSTRSKIVQREALNRLAAEMGLEQLIQAAQGTRMAHTNIGGNAFEALMGAIYLDRGFQYCHWFISNRVIGHFVDLDNVAQKEVNFKSKLLEWSQKNRININFRDVANDGNEKGFRTIITLEGISLGHGTGRSKKESQQLASKEALTRMRRDEKVYDSIFRAKEKRTAMEAEESFALPKIDEIEASISKDIQRNRSKNTDTPVLEKPAGNRAALESDLAYNTAYDENADFEVIDAPPVEHILTAADYEAKGLPAPPMENELEAAEEREKASRRKRHAPKTVNEAVKGFKKKGSDAEQPAKQSVNSQVNKSEVTQPAEKENQAKPTQQPKVEGEVEQQQMLRKELENQPAEKSKKSLEAAKCSTRKEEQPIDSVNEPAQILQSAGEEHLSENQTALPEKVLQDALRQASETAFATVQVPDNAQGEPCLSYLLAAVSAKAEEREQQTTSVEQQTAVSSTEQDADIPSDTTLADEVSELADEVSEPADEVSEPANEVSEPADEVSEPAMEETEQSEANVETAGANQVEEVAETEAEDIKPELTEVLTEQVDVRGSKEGEQPALEAAVPEKQSVNDTDDVSTTAICDLTAGLPEDEEFHAIASQLISDTQIISFPIDEVNEDAEDGVANALTSTCKNSSPALPEVEISNGADYDDCEDTPMALAITQVTIPADSEEDVLSQDICMGGSALCPPTSDADAAKEEPAAEMTANSKPESVVTHSEKIEQQDFIITKDLIPVESEQFNSPRDEDRKQAACSLQSDAVMPKLRHLSLDDFVFGMNSEGANADIQTDEAEVQMPKNRKPRRKRRKPTAKPSEVAEAATQETSVKTAKTSVRSKGAKTENAVRNTSKAKEQQPKAKTDAQSAGHIEGKNAQSKPQRRHRRPGRKSEA